MSSRARVVALLVMAVIVLAALAILGLWANSGGRGGEGGTAGGGAAAPTREPLTAQTAYQAARAAAEAWQGDAWLIDLSASWPNATRERVLAGQPGWTFQFYSPQTREVQSISVAQDTVALTRRRAVSVAPAPIDEAAWRLSAEDAALLFLAHGGERYLEQSRRSTFHLHLAAEDGRVVWTGIAVGSGADPLVVRFDATSGERLP
ncbi:MAG: hypothetical protein JW900_09175 [Anaerolineae bacterium]|nr:hypothetical protein [Anaerolineae bacterium]